MQTASPNLTHPSSATKPPVHIINHTHWDREWFLTEEYTTEWIPQLIDAIDKIREANPHYRYLLDGQTLICEDLIRTQPQYSPLLTDLVSRRILEIGPLYSQPDWRIASGELLLRNISTGIADVAHYGGQTKTAWLVDTFGHISQAPQMLSLFAIEAVYLWRGVPQLEPVFNWAASDGSKLTAINLFGGYRNLYGISKTPNLAMRRLAGEYEKLAPFYGALPTPLFDGYDLETEPEDPVAILQAQNTPTAEANAEANCPQVLASSSEQYVQALTAHLASAPTIEGELLSGKYGATFPGSLSTRTYLKLLHADTEHLLHRICEPLAALGNTYNRSRYENWNRQLLQNAVHDCICGVSIDAVHERMERSYRSLLNAMHEDAENSLAHICCGLKDGQYVLSTSAIPRLASVQAKGLVYEFNSDGFGLFAATSHPIKTHNLSVEELPTPFGPLKINNDHTINIGNVVVVPLEVRHDEGDSYSSEPKDLLTIAHITQVTAESVSAIDGVLAVAMQACWEDGELTAELRFRFSQNQTVELDLSLDSRGTAFVAELCFSPPTPPKGQKQIKILAGMPFDLVPRNSADNDLFGHEIHPDLARVLMGQREAHEVSTFPFHDFVTTFDGERCFVVHARGIRAYRCTPDGKIILPLRRSVEWLAKSGLTHRAGDAGPAIYVPGARCERKIQHQLGMSVIPASPDDKQLLAACEAFRNPPTLVEVKNSQGTHKHWKAFAASLPMSALQPNKNVLLARFYNPTHTTITTQTHSIAPKKIVELPIMQTVPAADTTKPTVNVHGLPKDRAGRSTSLPKEHILQHLREQADALAAKAQTERSSLQSLQGDAYHLGVHRALVYERELQELKLSLALNQLRLDAPDAEVSLPDKPLPAIEQIGKQLNDLRIQRRIYDYVDDLLKFQALDR